MCEVIGAGVGDDAAQIADGATLISAIKAANRTHDMAGRLNFRVRANHEWTRVLSFICVYSCLFVVVFLYCPSGVATSVPGGGLNSKVAAGQTTPSTSLSS